MEEKILIRKKEKQFIKELGKEVITTKETKYYVKNSKKDIHTKYGKIKKEDLETNGTVKSDTGKAFLIYPASFADRLKELRRLPQSPMLKDMALILAETGITKDSTIVEAGTGSAILTIFLAKHCKRVVSYEIREDHIKQAKQNIEEMKQENIVIKQKNIEEGIEETNVDAVILDLPEPWKVIETAKKAVKSGGSIVTYLPSTQQLLELIKEVKKHEEIIMEKTTETIERVWKTEEKSIRPLEFTTAHSAFITFMRAA